MISSSYQHPMTLICEYTPQLLPTLVPTMFYQCQTVFTPKSKALVLSVHRDFATALVIVVELLKTLQPPSLLSCFTEYTNSTYICVRGRGPALISSNHNQHAFRSEHESNCMFSGLVFASSTNLRLFLPASIPILQNLL